MRCFTSNEIPMARIPFVLEVIFALAKAGISSDPGL
ncbi:MAG: hypothetical protein Ct9H90mP6_10920 [Gammaproteobacteria bacterium]|nr:MAG: hypothetical protein Ct9H90mP6_10920 [Gammaproteobacteria bacterium]